MYVLSRVGLLVTLALGTSLSCSEGSDEGVVLRIESDLSIPERVNVISGVLTENDGSPGGSFGFAVGSPPAGTSESFCLEGFLPALVFVGGAPGDRITIDLSADHVEAGERTVIVEQRLVVYMPRDRVVLLPVNLALACADVTCPSDETCQAGECRSNLVDSGLLADVDSERFDELTRCN